MSETCTCPLRNPCRCVQPTDLTCPLCDRPLCAFCLVHHTHRCYPQPQSLGQPERERELVPA